jgi:hypothetical protein
MTASVLGYMVLHAAVAGMFGFLLQRYFVGATLEMSLIWAVVFGAGAAGLAWHQSNRQGRT